MTERFAITNLLLLLVLASILLVSGGLQCAFNCLPQTDHHHTTATRVDDCHYVAHQPDPEYSCANKACHQGNPQRHDINGPQLFSLNSLPLPFSSPSRQQLPQLRAGTALKLPPAQQPILLAGSIPDVLVPSQQLISIRTTVLLN